MNKQLEKARRFFFHRHPRKTTAAILLLTGWLFSLPTPLFDDPTCMVLEDREGELLGAKIASDGQWRFPERDSVPFKFAQAITTFEDKRFYYHPGVDPLSMLRAFWQNVSEWKVVSGGSTLTMQTIRLARKGQSRSLWEKCVEIWLATRLELSYSKDEILALYASHAPFGGNVVGIDAASWRYFGKSPALLSWSEAVTLAVLPNSPALIHPGRNRSALLEKRNRLLDKLVESGKIDSLTSELAKEEALPDEPLPLPRLAPHLLDRAWLEHFQSKKKSLKTRLKTTLQKNLQQQVNDIAERHIKILKANEINNLAILVADVETGEVLAYVGNASGTGAEHGEDVDVIPAPRSTGSILKPFLYALMLHEGSLLPSSLVSDVPMNFGGYTPENYKETYDGAIPASRAITRSLNVPLVRMLQEYGLERFHFGLRHLGLTTITRPPDYYGLPLILGGAEASLWDLTGVYSSMARTLNHFPENNGLYDPEDFRPLHYDLQKTARETPKDKLLKEAPVLNASSTWFTFQAMKDLERPNELGEWEVFRSSRRIAWKTGTSYGFRDAWAIGVTPRYAVGVWAGNADGEGRPGLVGVLTAAPILFDVFEILPSSAWFSQPFDEMTGMPVCRNSGFKAGALCEADSVQVPVAGLRSPACPYHQLVHLDETGKWRVNGECEVPAKMQHVPWFVLPPVEEHYFKTKNPGYKPLPPFRPDCIAESQGTPMQLIYPRQLTRIYVPTDLDGQPGKAVFKAAHRDPEAVIFWHLDAKYLGSTHHFHHFEFNPAPGAHHLTLVDNKGNRLEQDFEIIGKDEK